jgi:preprotein translocase subunit YajC
MAAPLQATRFDVIHELLFFFQAQRTGPGFSIFLFQMLAFVGIIYFLMIRPKMRQEKQHRERLSQLRKGDEIVTAGGIVGKIVHIGENNVTIRSDESRLVVSRARIAEINTPQDGNDEKAK